ncbi:fungal-specific transcription factor domain-containing protein [Ilyonectria sp. MPI-CAGE-AT-0026]|nr:fungal-specific transcription factor domain-containing protein [Ilyonectria sp. MPI-CAGE-AT-0026]
MKPSSKTAHFKSRNGCLRCKTKKTKCDERRPACARCEDRGFRCPGYALNVRWSQRHQMYAERPVQIEAIQSPAQGSSPGSERGKDIANTPACSITEVSAASEVTATGNYIQQLDLGLSPSTQWDFSMLCDPLAPQDELYGFDDDAVNELLSEEAPVSTTDPIWDPSFMGVSGSFPNGTTSALHNVEGTTGGQKRSTDVMQCARKQSNLPKEQRLRQYQHQPLQDACRQGLVEAGDNPFLDRPRDLFNLPSALSDYFFREVITLYCTWDSDSNAMRNIVEKMWQSSGALYHTTQSMAAACLSEDFPHLASIATAEHRQALEYIQGRSQQSTMKEDNLLANMLLGHTASWLNPQNLATDLFRGSYMMLKDTIAETGDGHDLSFFSDTMDYWAMLLVYLTDSSHLGDYRRDFSTGPTRPSTTSIEPHPFSGISRETIRMLTDVGILIFQYRKCMLGVKFMTEKDLDVFRATFREARRLERMLLAHRAPDVTQITDPGDPKTPLIHLQHLDEAYRCTGLLQIYRVFPDLLNERYAPWNKEDILRPPPATNTPTAEERNIWLTKLAMHILGILRQIPFESRTRSVQPFILVAISSELRRDSHATSSDSSQRVLSFDHHSIEVARARKFVGSRLAAYTHILPLRKIRMIFELINCIWAALDAGDQDVYWLDVAYERNLGTMMG